MIIKCKKCDSMFEIDEQWGAQPDLAFPCSTCQTQMTVRANRVDNKPQASPKSPPGYDRTEVGAPAMAAPASKFDHLQKDRTAAMPGLDGDVDVDAPTMMGERVPGAPIARAKAEPPAESTMMMASPPAHMFEENGGAEATAFLENLAPPPGKKRDDFAFAATGARKAPGAVKSVRHTDPESTAFLQSTIPPDSAEATAFLQSSVPPPAARKPQPTRPGVAPRGPAAGVIDSAAGESTAFLDAGGGLHTPQQADLHEQATQMVQAVDEAQIESWLAQQRSKEQQQQQIGHEQRDINPDAGGGKTAVWDGVDMAVTGGYREPVAAEPAVQMQHKGGAPVSWGAAGTAPAGTRGAAPQPVAKSAAKKKGGALKWMFLIILVLGGLGTGAYFLFFNN